jgi:two-component system KDP operon response regulator KdpE
VTKPFTSNILIARAQAVLRRAALPAVAQTLPLYSDGYLTIDLNQRRVLVGGDAVKLSAKEYRLLTYLFLNAGRVLTTPQILKNVWGWEYQDQSDYVHVYISYLRQKLEENPRKPRYLLTEYGVGYRFEKADSLPKQPVCEETLVTPEKV